MTPAKPTLLELYFQYVEETEAPVVFHRWSFFASIGAVLGRNYWFPFGTTRIFPNCYIMLIGNPGTRKSSAIKTSKKVLARSGFDKFAAEKTTKEKFLLDLEGAPENDNDGFTNTGGRSRVREYKAVSSQDVLAALDLADNGAVHDGIAREVYIVADEFNEFAGSGNLDFYSLLGSLWDWDDEHSPYRQRLKNSKSVSIYQPTISLLGGNTHTGFQSAFPVEALGQGFMSRLLLIHGEPSGRKITFPKQPPTEIGDSLERAIREIAEKVNGAATMAPDAERALDAIYRTWVEIEDYRFKHYSTRRFTHLLKLVLICTALRCVTRIDMEDVLLANTMLTYAESQMPKALGEFGKSKNSEAAQAIMSKLYETTKPLTANDLWHVVSRDLDKRDQLADILHGLQQAGKIQFVEKKGFLPQQKPMNTKALYVDFKLLKELNGR